jgi:hypothetical protein
MASFRLEGPSMAVPLEPSLYVAIYRMEYKGGKRNKWHGKLYKGTTFRCMSGLEPATKIIFVKVASSNEHFVAIGAFARKLDLKTILKRER